MPPRRPGVTGRPSGPLRTSLDYLLGARSRVAVLRILTAQNDPVSQRELARRAGVQVRSAQQAVKADAIAGLILFGSAARGDDVPTSDFDLLLLTARDPARDDWPHRFAALAADVKATFGVDARLLVMTRAEARARWKRREAPIPQIIAEGIPLVGPPARDLITN